MLASVLCALAACGTSDAPPSRADAGHEHLDADVFDPNSFTGARRLSETGLYANLAERTLAGDVAEYEIAYPLWSDGSEKRRFLALPEGTRIDTDDVDAWVFPVGTRAWKEFRVGGRAIETRLLRKLDAETWESVSYVWREDGSDADARPEGAADALGTTHDVPDVAGCIDCHRGSKDGLLGLSATQLSPASVNESVERLVSRGWLDSVPPSPLVATDVERAALGYLHGNCGHCHGPSHPLARLRALRLHLPYRLTTAANAPAVTTTVGAVMAHEIRGLRIGVVTRNPDASQLLERMRRRGDGNQMPARGSEVVDADGVAAVRAWISAMPSE